MLLWGRETGLWGPQSGGVGARLAQPGWQKVMHVELPAPETERGWWCQLGVCLSLLRRAKGTLSTQSWDSWTPGLALT